MSSPSWFLVCQSSARSCPSVFVLLVHRFCPLCFLLPPPQFFFCFSPFFLFSSSSLSPASSASPLLMVLSFFPPVLGLLFSQFFPSFSSVFLPLFLFRLLLSFFFFFGSWPSLAFMKPENGLCLCVRVSR